MPIKPPPPMVLYGDLERARKIVRSWKPLDHLSPVDAEIVAKAIAEGIAEGRRHGFELAKADLEASQPQGDAREEANPTEMN